MTQVESDTREPNHSICQGEATTHVVLPHERSSRPRLIPSDREQRVRAQIHYTSDESCNIEYIDLRSQAGCWNPSCLPSFWRLRLHWGHEKVPLFRFFDGSRLAAGLYGQLIILEAAIPKKEKPGEC